MRVVFRGSVRVNLTEDQAKVRRAVENIFPTAHSRLIVDATAWLRFEGEGLEAFTRMRSILQQDRIRDAVRKELFRQAEDNHLTFYLNKQVAFMGHVSLCQPRRESPLGPIEVEIECDDLEGFIQWLSPPSEARG
ncbi:MAG: RNA-binding domain-containing protein [Candidatus Bathyarchaeia archaeon]